MSNEDKVYVAEHQGHVAGFGWTPQEAAKQMMARGFTSGSTREADAQESAAFRSLNARLISPEALEAHAVDLQEVRMTRAQAEMTPVFQRYERYAERLGLPLRIIDDGPGTPLPAEAAPLVIHLADAQQAQRYRAAKARASSLNTDVRVADAGEDVPRVGDDPAPAWFVPAGEPISIKRSELENGAIYRREERRGHRPGAGYDRQ